MLEAFYFHANTRIKSKKRKLIMKSQRSSKKSASKSSQTKNDADGKAKIILLTSSLLVDRVFLHTNLIDSLNVGGDVTIWAASKNNELYSSAWNKIGARVEPFPEIFPFMEVPHNYLRRLNEFAWDYQFKLPSRMSLTRHVRDKSHRFSVKALKLPARVIAGLNLERRLENALEKIMLNYPRSPEAYDRIKREKPEVIVSTGPFQYEQPAIFAAAKKLGVPTLAYIPSWDNVTTKNRFVYKYDGYIVWSEQTKKELHEFYPASRNVPVYITGAPQFDIFFQDRFYRTRERFCADQNLDPALPIIVYALGSPNFLQEQHGAIELAKRIARGELGEVQMLVRPHPIHDNAEMEEVFRDFAPRVQLQKTPNAGIDLTGRTQDGEQIAEWINTFRHADVVVNLSSTVTVDAAIFDKPVVNLDFDPQPTRADQELIKDINHRWNHFKPIAESGGVWLVDDFDELTRAVKTYLRAPHLHRDKRRWISQYVCGYLDGKCGARMAEAIRDFSQLSKNQQSAAEANAIRTPNRITAGISQNA